MSISSTSRACRIGGTRSRSSWERRTSSRPSIPLAPTMQIASSTTILLLVILEILAALDPAPPGLMGAVPLNRLHQARPEIDQGPPAKFVHGLRGVDGVAAVVAGPVGDVFDHRLVPVQPGQQHA